jgi:hypothetical protein
LNGSQYYIAISGGAQLFNATASGSVTLQYLWITNVNVNVVIRLANYLEWDGAGTITNTGLSMNVTQAADGAY